MKQVLRQAVGSHLCLSWSCFSLGGKEQKQTEEKEKESAKRVLIQPIH